MKIKSIWTHRWSNPTRLFVCAFLAIVLTFASTGSANAFGFHTHAYIGAATVNFFRTSPNDQLLYPELIRILNTHYAWVEAGEVFPDWVMAASNGPSPVITGVDATTINNWTEVVHSHLENANGSKFHEVYARYLIPDIRQTPWSVETEQKIAFLLGMIGHNVQDDYFDPNLLGTAIVMDGVGISNICSPVDLNPHQRVDMAVNAFAYFDLSARGSPASWQYPVSTIMSMNSEMGFPIPYEWVRDGTNLMLPAGYDIQEVASICYYLNARFLSHGWLYSAYNNWIPGGIVDNISKTATAWRATWDWLMAYTPVTTAKFTLAIPNGENGWYRSAVTMDFSVGDNFDGLPQHMETGPMMTPYTIQGIESVWDGEEFSIDLEGEIQISYYSVDAGYVREDITHYTTLKIDRSIPQITVWTDKPEYIKSDIFIVHFSVSDDYSGIASQSAELNGQPVVNGQTVLLSDLPSGTHTLTVHANDLAGNQTVVEKSFVVLHTFFMPIITLQ